MLEGQNQKRNFTCRIKKKKGLDHNAADTVRTIMQTSSLTGDHISTSVEADVCPGELSGISLTMFLELRGWLKD